MDRDWVLHVMDTVSGFSRGETGITRLALSPEEMQARSYVTGLMQELGMKIRVDAIGNIIGHIEGTDPAAAPVCVGSHLDSVPEGGRYDGVLGVVAGLAAIRRISKEGHTKHPLELIIFTAEESSRFGFGTMAAKRWLVFLISKHGPKPRIHRESALWKRWLRSVFNRRILKRPHALANRCTLLSNSTLNRVRCWKMRDYRLGSSKPLQRQPA